MIHGVSWSSLQQLVMADTAKEAQYLVQEVPRVLVRHQAMCPTGEAHPKPSIQPR